MPLDQLDDLIETTLDDYLLALADGIQQAQRQLDQVTVAGRPGQPATGYHLPRVEFELKMTFAMRGATPGGEAPQGERAGGRSGTLLMRPPAKSDPESYSGEATSTIRGAFVAVPVVGRTPTTLRCSLVRRNPREIGLVVFLADALGVPQVDVVVQIDVDRERSAELGAGEPLLKDTDVELGLLRTDANGFAATTLRIADTEPDGAVIVMVIEAAGASETVMVQVTP